MLMRTAMRAGKRHREVCGLLVRSGNRLQLIPVKNASRDLGSFLITPRNWVDALAAKHLHSNQVLGTYHSHPASPPEPGESDIAGSSERSLMLIYACTTRKAKLWLIRNDLAKRVCLIVN